MRATVAGGAPDRTGPIDPDACVFVPSTGSGTSTADGDTVLYGMHMPVASGGSLYFAGAIMKHGGRVPPTVPSSNGLYPVSVLAVRGDGARTIAHPTGTSPLVLSPEQSALTLWTPELFAASGDTLHAVWRDRPSGELRYAMEHAGAWSTVESIGTVDGLALGGPGGGASNLLVDHTGLMFLAPFRNPVPEHGGTRITWALIRRDRAGWHIDDITQEIGGVSPFLTFLFRDGDGVTLAMLAPDSAGFSLFTSSRPDHAAAPSTPTRVWAAYANGSRGMQGIATASGGLLAVVFSNSREAPGNTLYAVHVAGGMITALDTLERESPADAVWLSMSVTGRPVVGIRTSAGVAYAFVAQSHGWKKVHVSGNDWWSPPVLSFAEGADWFHIVQRAESSGTSNLGNRTALGRVRCGSR